MVKIYLRAVFSLLISLFILHIGFSQETRNKYELESQTIGTSKEFVPFWMRSNQFGSVPLSGISQSFIGKAYRDFNSLSRKDSINDKMRLLDWGFGFEGRLNIGEKSEFQLVEGYIKARIGIFNIVAGRNRNVMGLNGDTILSSGNFSVSGNSLGIPRLELVIPEYYYIPIFDGFFSVKGNFLHGWVGRQRINHSLSDDFYPKTYYHQKSIYIRLGKDNSNLKVFGGFNHQAYWGDQKITYGSDFDLSKLETFYYVLTGKKYGNKSVPNSKIGNQIGSVDIGIQYNFNSIDIMVYRQNFYDVGALAKLANITDGLNGITIENKKFNSSNKNFKWRKILIEIFYSKDQAGYPWSKPTASGDEDYYNNFYYGDGWSYKGMGIGNPLITKKTDAKDGQTSINQYFINNRVVALHFGLEGSINEWRLLTKMTYSSNNGTFATSKYGQSLGGSHDNPGTELFKTVKQFSFYIETAKTFKNNITTGFVTSFDRGQLLNNSFGIILKIKKTI